MGVAETVRVDARSRSYDVVVGWGLLASLGARVHAVCKAENAFVVSDSNVAPLYLAACEASLTAAGLRVASHVFPAGEQHKRMGTFEQILEDMAGAGLTRDDVVIALGGGVVGDMAGFAAASYMRGIEVVQVPTTLLAMVDSSVGGKTAIDLSTGKNLVGAFLQPSLVVADVSLLATLDDEVFTDGMGEVVKHGVLADEELFDELAVHPLLPGTSDLAYLAHIVARNVAIKRDVVNADETERGLRQTLNLGHTLGHAIEAAHDFTLGHGHCVAAGLCCIARAAEALGWAEAGLSARIDRCVAAQGLPIDTEVAHQTLLVFATLDKKRHGDGVNVIVPTDISRCEIRRVSLAAFSHIIDLGCGTSPA